MLIRRSRLRTVALGAAIAILAVAAPAPGAASLSAGCSATTGVTVIVDFTHFSGGKVERGCAPGQPANGLIALHNAGFTSAGTAQYGDAFVCRINGLPTPQKEACAVTPSPTAYWAFWSARPSDSGWTYSSVGVLDFHPKAGTIEAFAFGSRAQPSVSPSDAVPPATTSTTAKAPPPTVPHTSPPPVTAATQPIAPGTTTTAPDVGPGGTMPTTTPHSTPEASATTKPKRKPARATSTTVHKPTTTESGPEIVDRAASRPIPHDDSGSPLGAILAVVIVGGLGIGAFAFTRARRRRPA